MHILQWSASLAVLCISSNLMHFLQWSAMHFQSWKQPTFNCNHWQPPLPAKSDSSRMELHLHFNEFVSPVCTVHLWKEYAVNVIPFQVCIFLDWVDIDNRLVTDQWAKSKQCDGQSLCTGHHTLSLSLFFVVTFTFTFLVFTYNIANSLMVRVCVRATIPCSQLSCGISLKH